MALASTRGRVVRARLSGVGGTTSSTGLNMGRCVTRACNSGYNLRALEGCLRRGCVSDICCCRRRVGLHPSRSRLGTCFGRGRGSCGSYSCTVLRTRCSASSSTAGGTTISGTGTTVTGVASRSSVGTLVPRFYSSLVSGCVSTNCFASRDSTISTFTNTVSSADIGSSIRDGFNRSVTS